MSETKSVDVEVFGSTLFVVADAGWSIDDRTLVIDKEQAKKLVRVLQGVLYEQVVGN